VPASAPDPAEIARRRSGPRVWAKRWSYRVAYRLLQIYHWVGPKSSRSRGVKCALTYRGRLVLVRHTYGPRDLWHVPGGGARRGESLRAAADREMEEELGVRGLQWRDLQPVQMRLGRRRVRIPCLQAELAGPDLAPDAGEIAEARLFARDRLPAPLAREDRPLVAAALTDPATGPAT
jgi:ADP-ribose pyrophosphatase YjhB (NUDIX family)